MSAAQRIQDAGRVYEARRGLFSSITRVTGELTGNVGRIWRIAMFEIKARHGGMILGNLWNFLNPAFQILVYWFVFGVCLNVSTMDDGISYATWLMGGILPWFFINGAMMHSTTSILSSAGMLQNIPFPVAAVPAKSVVIDLIGHLWTVAILVPVILILGARPGWQMLYVLYYMACALSFLIAFAIFVSAINAVFRDFAQFLNPMLRLLMYISSVVWSIDRLSPELQGIMRLNPVTYLIEGYRGALLYLRTPFVNWQRDVYFWAFTIILYAVGCAVHCRLRDHFIDVI